MSYERAGEAQRVDAHPNGVLLERDAPLLEERQTLSHGLVDVDKDLLAVGFQFGLVEAFEVDDLRVSKWVSSRRSPCAKLGADLPAHLHLFL